jgi:hypothetical protein
MLVVSFAIGMFGIMTLLPLMLGPIMHYPAEVVGEVMAPRGLTMGVFMMVIGRYVGRFDPRGMMFVGASSWPAAPLFKLCFRRESVRAGSPFPASCKGSGCRCSLFPRPCWPTKPCRVI